mgnify:CR=1 FL=1
MALTVRIHRLIALACSIPIFLTACSRVSTPPARNDVIILTLDTLRADTTGFGGFPGPITPWLDRLSIRSTVFSNAYTAIPITNASHATIMTGCQPARHECRGFGKPLGESTRTIAEVLKAEGYATGAFLSGYPLERRIARLDRGFDRYDDEWMKGQSTVDRPAARTVDAAIQYLDSIPITQPVFIWIHFFDPHKPYDPPEPDGRRFDPEYSRKGVLHQQRMMLQEVVPEGKKAATSIADTHGYPGTLDPELSESDTDDATIPPDLEKMRARYHGETVYMDREIGRFLNHWQTKRDIRHTRIAVVADHGESFEKGYYYRHVHRLFESIIHVPMMIYQGKKTPPAVRSDLARTKDIAPTLLGLLTLPPLASMEGRHLFAVSTESGNGSPEAVFSETQPLIRSTWGGPFIAAVTRRLKLVRSTGTGRVELFDIERDPGEVFDLLNDTHDAVVRQDPVFDRIRSLLSDFETVQAVRRGESGEPAEALDGESQDKLKSLGYLQ